MRPILVRFTALLLLASSFQARAEVFTALVEMEGLLKTEEQLIDFLNKYIQREEEFVQKLRYYLQKYENQWQEASRDIQKYLQNPVNAYLMVKSLSSDWLEVEHLMSDNDEFVENFLEQKESLKFPGNDDLTGAAEALMRLQDTYNLDTAALARGEIKGTHLTSQLKGTDCYELGKQAYNLGSHYHTVLWMEEAMKRIGEEKNTTISEKDIIEYLAYSYYVQGHLRKALKLTKELLKLDPDNSMATHNLVYYEEEIKKIEEHKANGDEERSEETPIVDKGSLNADYPGKSTYEQLCRGEKLSYTREEKEEDLFCRYTSSNNLFYLLRPFKEESMSINPHIAIFHDLMSDGEMDIIKELSTSKLNRAKVQDAKTGDLIDANYRISKSAWLDDIDHPVVDRISRRIEAATGLTMKTAEPLQVTVLKARSQDATVTDKVERYVVRNVNIKIVNYGIGGHYEPHYDFARKEEVNAFKSLNTGNRIATMLFYMSDVEAGGATVFPNIGVALWPEKGAAAFWYNLHKNGDGDFNTKHAGCPVLSGSKWVSNKWIHEYGQEFRYPCGLNSGE